MFPDIDPRDLPAAGTQPGSGAPEHDGDARGVFSNVSDCFCLDETLVHIRQTI